MALADVIRGDPDIHAAKVNEVHVADDVIFLNERHAF